MIEEEGQSVEREYEMIKTDIPILKKPKIVGTIDLSTINARIRPKKKSRAELQQELQEQQIARTTLKEELREKRKRKIEEEKENLAKQQVVELENVAFGQAVKKTGLKVFLTRLFKRG